SGRISSAPAVSAIRLPIFSSWRQLEYLAHALKRNFVASKLLGGWPILAAFFAARVGNLAGVRNIHPESRIQTRLVAQQWNRMFFDSAFALSSSLRTRRSVPASLTINSTRSCRARLRTISV